MKLGKMKEVMSSLRVVEVDPSTDPRWERFLTKQPNALISHHPAWLQVIEVYGDHPSHLGCFDTSGELRGVLPLCSKRRVLGGHIFSSLPYTSLAGPLADDEQIAALLVQEAIARTREEPGATLRLQMLSPTLENGEMIGAPASPTYVLALPEHPDLLIFGDAKNHASIKRAVSKAAKLGVSVREAETERDLWAWYKLYAATMLDLAILPHSYRFLVGAWRHLQPKGMLRLLLAEHVEASRTTLLGGIVLLLFGQTVSYAFVGWDRSQQALRANDALQWRALHDACRDGFRWYDFGQTALSNEGLTHYKRKWRAQATMIYTYHYPAAARAGTGMQLRDANSRSRQIALATLRRLPIKAVDVLSNWLRSSYTGDR